LNSNGELTTETINTIKTMNEHGEIFSIATARSLSRTQEISTSLHLVHPIILYNGVFLVEPLSGKTLLYNHFDEDTNNYLKVLFKQYDILPNVYSFIDGIEKVSLIPDYNNEYKNYYLETRKNDKRLNFVNATNDLYLGDIFSYLCIGTKSDLQPLYDKLKVDSRFSVVFQQELYREEYWLDIAPRIATKANAAKKLQELLNCNKIIAFGDSINDMELFSTADESYAVENAKQELKSIASGIIDSNNNDGVAKWLQKNVLESN
jgi:Cof subfamily protein (haloacid dehalogenase superfamily)